MDRDIFLPYGLNNSEKIVHISEVESGQTELTCPFCDSNLIAKKGPRLTHHFSHAENTCRSLAKGELEDIVPVIPFYSDFFSNTLSEAERRAVNILYNQFGLELFYRKGKTNSAFHVLFQHDILKISQVWENLLSSRQIQQRGNWYQLTTHAEMGLGLLPISVFAEIQEQRLHFFEAFLEAGNEPLDLLRKKVYLNLKARLLDATLYCLHIPADQEKPDVWKIGITTRTAAHRLQELLPALIDHFGSERAHATQIVCELAGLGRLEAYIKKRFVASNYPFSYKGHTYTEFFADVGLLEELEAL